MPPRHDNPASHPALPAAASIPPAASSRRAFLKGLASLGTGLAASTLLASEPTQAQAAGAGVPGAAQPWHAAVPLYGGHNNLSTGNTQFALAVCGWGGLGGGASFALVFNTQSQRTSALGARWTHSYNLFLTGSNPVVFVDGDGSETAYTLANGVYTPPTGCYDTLVQNADATWTLARKGGSKVNFTSAGVLASVADANGLTTSFAYANGLLTSVTDAANRTLTLGYTGGQLTSVTDCQNKTYTLAYANSLPTSLTTPPLSGQTYSQQITHDGSGNVNSLADRLGLTWGYTYRGGLLTNTTLPGSANGGYPHKQLMTEDVNDWPANVVTLMHWHDANAQITAHGLDNLGRLVAVQDAAGNRTVHTYDNSHNRIATQLPSGKTWHSTFDSAGNELIRQDPLGHQTAKTYDAQSRLLTHTDANNHTTTYGYDNNGNVTSVQDGNSNTAAYGVNALGQQTSLTDAENRAWLYGYDAKGFLNSSQDAFGNVTQFVNDSAGQQTQRTDARSRVTNYTLDDWGRVAGVAYPTTNNPGLGFSYNAAGQLTQTVDGTGLRTYGYNTLGQRTGMTDPRGNTSATYDNLNNLLTQTDVSGRQITNTLNAINQLTQVTDGNDNASATYTYTADGQVNTVIYPNGTQAAYGYDGANRVTSLTHSKVSNGSLLVGYTAAYDNGGRITSITEQPSGDVTTYTYDAVDNLLSETRTGSKPYSGVYTYDKSNRRKTAVVVTNGVTTHNGTYTYDAAGRLSQVVDAATNTTENYAWNADGTLASYPGPQGSGYTRLLEYDEEQHLVRIKHSANGTATTAYEYGYAADGGRRWQKDYANNVWTWYPCGVACSAGELVEQTSDLTGSAWTTSALYMKAGSSCGAKLIRRNGEYHHVDVLGNIPLITGSTGTVSLNLLTDMFNVPRFSTGSAQSTWITAGAYTGSEGLLMTQSVCIILAERALAFQEGCLSDPPDKKQTYKDCQSLSTPEACRDCCYSVFKQNEDGINDAYNQCMAANPRNPAKCVAKADKDKSKNLKDKDKCIDGCSKKKPKKTTSPPTLLLL